MCSGYVLLATCWLLQGWAEGRVVGPADKGAVRGGLLTEIYTDKYSATGDNNGGGHWEEGNWLMTGVLTSPFYTDISYV